METFVITVISPKWTKDHHSRSWYPNGHKVESFVEYRDLKSTVPKIPDYTPDLYREWQAGQWQDVSDLMLKEAGSDGTLLSDILAFLKIDAERLDSQYKPLPPIQRQTEYLNLKHKQIADSLGNTMSSKMLAYKNKH